MIVVGKNKYLIVNDVGYIPYFRIINVSYKENIITIELEGAKNKISFHYGAYKKLDNIKADNVNEAIEDIIENVMK